MRPKSAGGVSVRSLMRTMPMKLRRECENDPAYSRCARQEALHDHICQPRPSDGQLIEWEHAIIFAGKQVNEKWAIVPLCWYVHSGPGLVKEINVWLALNQAKDSELDAVSKVLKYVLKRKKLNQKYGKKK